MKLLWSAAGYTTNAAVYNVYLCWHNWLLFSTWLKLFWSAGYVTVLAISNGAGFPVFLCLLEKESFQAVFTLFDIFLH